MRLAFWSRGPTAQVYKRTRIDDDLDDACGSDAKDTRSVLVFAASLIASIGVGAGGLAFVVISFGPQTQASSGLDPAAAARSEAMPARRSQSAGRIFDKPPSDASSDGGALAQRAATLDNQWRDVVDFLEEAIRCRRSRRHSIATGRFLRDFEERRALLGGLDLRRVKLLRWGAGWVRLEAPCEVQTEPGPIVAMAELRIVRVDAKWKITSLDISAGKEFQIVDHHATDGVAIPPAGRLHAPGAWSCPRAAEPDHECSLHCVLESGVDLPDPSAAGVPHPDR